MGKGDAIAGSLEKGGRSRRFPAFRQDTAPEVWADISGNFHQRFSSISKLGVSMETRSGVVGKTELNRWWQPQG
ncbi:MAG: hypothetical protein ACP5D7_25875 [Limnospira sp.]